MMTGIGLRAPHYQEVLNRRPVVGFLEVHSENYFGDGGFPHYFLERIGEHYPLSLHGVGLSIGSVDALCENHLARLRNLIRRYRPRLVSEHLCWSSFAGVHLNDLLPLPYTEEALRHVVDRIAYVQELLDCELLIENVSSYLRYRYSPIPEWEFLSETATRSGCAILLDVNNVHVSAQNHGFDAIQYIDAIPADRIKQIHLAGFATNHYPHGDMVIDHHGGRVSDAVWDLYARLVTRIGRVPTLIEWDTDLPAIDVLLSEAQTADRIAKVVA